LKETLKLLKAEKKKLEKVKGHYDAIYDCVDSILYYINSAIDTVDELEGRLKKKGAKK